MLEETPPKLWDLYEAMIHDSSNKLNVGQIQCRNSILLLLVGTQAPITWKEISSALSLRGDSEEVIFELCGQLVTWAGDLLHFSHPTYASKARIAQLLRGNFNEPVLTTGIFPTREAMSYEYAARHWGYHLSKVVSPEPELLSIANEFLHSFQSVHWGEFAYRLARGNQNTASNLSIVQADYGYLHEWFAKLSEESKSQIGIDDFFIDPYERISKLWATPPEDDKVLPWMPLIRLGGYCWEMALVDQGIKFRREARNGCIETLGPRHPLTLRSRKDMCQVFMIEGRYLDALDEYNAVVDAQRDVLGPDNPAVYETLSHRGITEFLVTRFNGAIQSETEASKGLLRSEEPESTLYIVSQWILTWPLSYTGDYQKALEICQDLFRRRREKHGRGDPYALMFTMVMGELFRKLDRMEESIQRLEEGFDVQRQALTGSISQNMGLLDPAINLVLSYRESGQNDKAWKLIGEIEGPEDELPDNFYDRQCQITHVKGLLLSDEGKVNAAISLLQGFFVKINRDQYNRAVLWLLLDLAAMLRARGEEGDEDQALINFQNILRKIDEANSSPIEVIGDELGLEDDLTSEGEPDLPGLLHDAEHALTLVRNLKFAEAEMFLVEKQVEWYRQKDFWIIYGSVPADTTTMKPPSLEVVDEFIPISYPKRAKKCSLR
ncbi:uncharacterized protein F4812DRAFT_458588 [Daldinia caldariorum]|uniref:uncharacterized protein n=1 Tax=Daldinia caldariorum TaxID=326644 RepID=UPI0020085B65|nr:uncharacterized protein F4812DRAFT_458588 [Daldinia caldariorum]KAI1468152.1 hypothetical protein F4812DRAFT_458588 [Daldinia caldariorum]